MVMSSVVGCDVIWSHKVTAYRGWWTNWHWSVATTCHLLILFFLFHLEVDQGVNSAQAIFSSNQILLPHTFQLALLDDVLGWHCRLNLENAFSNLKVFSINRLCDLLFALPIQTSYLVSFALVIWNLKRRPCIAICHYINDTIYHTLIFLINFALLLLGLLFSMIL